jgi:hypothetical protein
MAAKQAPKRAKADQPATESRGSVEPATDGEATTALASAPQPAGSEDLVVPSSSDDLRRIRLLADIAGQVYRALTKWLTHKQKHMRVLGWITWLFLLALLGTVLIVLMFRWHPLHTVALLGASTGLVACANLINSRWRRRR